MYEDSKCLTTVVQVLQIVYFTCAEGEPPTSDLEGALNNKYARSAEVMSAGISKTASSIHNNFAHYT